MNTSINAPTPHEREDKKPDKPSSKSNEYKAFDTDVILVCTTSRENEYSSKSG